MNRRFIRILFICFFAFAFLMCSAPKQKELSHLEEYFKNTHDYKLSNVINKIVVIAEGNSCGSCENAFAETTFRYLRNENTVFLVTAMGTIINIQPFLQLDNNCFFDWQPDISEFPEFESSRVIYLKDNVIDTVVIINSKDLANQLQYIKENN